MKLTHSIAVMAAMVFLLAANNQALAESDPVKYAELTTTVVDMQQHIKVNQDYTFSEQTSLTIKALQETAVENLKRRRFSHSTSVETFEVLEAFTLKADGTRVEVPADNYQIRINKGRGEAGPAFSDRTSVSVVFPGLEVNDSVYIKYETVQTEPLFPGHFSHAQHYWRESPYENLSVTFDLPESLDMHLEVREMTREEEVRDGRRYIRLGYKNPKPIKSERQDYSVFDAKTLPGYAASTFDSYQQVADAYGARATPKAKPTERIQKLAKSLIGSEKESRKQARILYDWVAREISYAGNCIGVGAVVPRNLDIILDNKMGDCKDKATLLQAMLAAVGIESTQALVNSGSSYTLPDIAMVSAVNHAILYLPEWDLFVDPTPKDIPFGLIPRSIQDKPVILVGTHQPGKHTPAARIEDTVQSLHSEMTLQEDGSVNGSMMVDLQGSPAADVRSSWRELTEDRKTEMMERVFSSGTQKGEGTLEIKDEDPLSANYQYTITFRKPDVFLSKGAGGFVPYAMAPSPASIYGFLNTSAEPIEGYSIACGNGRSEETLVYHFPENYRILATPENYQVNENHIEFSATYQLEGQVLTVTRSVIDTTPANVCEPELMNRQRQTVTAIAEHLSSQVVYQVK